VLPYVEQKSATILARGFAWTPLWVMRARRPDCVLLQRARH
jgi:hypothetical protein